MTNAQTAKIVISFFWTKDPGICFKKSAVILLCSGENALLIRALLLLTKALLELVEAER